MRLGNGRCLYIPRLCTKGVVGFGDAPIGQGSQADKVQVFSRCGGLTLDIVDMPSDKFLRRGCPKSIVDQHGGGIRCG
jgi:hypothetical protein